MKTSSRDSTRRSFLWKAGAALSVPLAAVAPSAQGRVADEHDTVRARLAALEDANAIGELNLRYAWHVNARAHDEVVRLFAEPAHALSLDVTALVADPLGAGDDAVEIGASAQTATARLHCTVQREMPIEPVTPLVEMARAQGGGVARRSERGVLEGRYVKRDGTWKIERLVFRAA